MKRHNFIRRGLLLVLMIAMLSLPAYAAGTSLKIDAPASLPAVGGTFTVKVDISGNPGLCAAQYTLAFDKTVVTCVSASVGDVLKGTLSAANPDAADGAIVAAAATSPAKGDGSIGVFTFKVLKSGETGFTLKDAVFSDANGASISTNVPAADSSQKPSGTEKPEQPKSDAASLGIYVISRTLLINLLNQIIPEGRYSLVKDIIIRFIHTLKIYGYEYDGYWNAIGTGIAAYFETNMDFLKKDIRDHFINEYPYIETKPKNEPPAKYNRGADVTDSIVGSGAIFDGKVEHSVVFRRVRVGKGAVVRNSILMEGCQIGENCVVENAIFDKEVVLSAGQRVIGVSSEEPAVLKKGTKL